MSNQLIKRLSEFNEEQLKKIYHNVFDCDEGQLVLEDLKGRFFEYVPVSNMTEVGSENVLKHIKNMLNPPAEE